MAESGQMYLYLATADAIRRQIAEGELKPGDRVGPSLEVLAKEHKVGLSTMRAALAYLGREGLTKTIPGKGSFVETVPADTGVPRDDDNVLAAEVAELRDDVDGLQVSVMEIYTRMGWDHPAQRQADENGKARHEQAG
jgi:DNA-binding transcriptional regulator YhcF (GntR family)